MSSAKGVDLRGKVALITGAAQGQGEAEARCFAELGAKVLLADLFEEQAARVAGEIGEQAMSRPLDVTSEEAWQSVVDDVVAHWGRLDVLVNNAGVLVVAPLARTTLAEYRRVIEVNQIGVFLGMKAVLPAMSRYGNGSIINISSVDGIVGMAGACAYAASKFAVRGMTKVAALEFAPAGIRVNSIHPGVVDTPMLQDPRLVAADAVNRVLPMVPLGRAARAAEIAELAAFLAADASGYCTGAEFVIDGGLTAGIRLADG